VSPEPISCLGRWLVFDSQRLDRLRRPQQKAICLIAGRSSEEGINGLQARYNHSRTRRQHGCNTVRSQQG
jgi:hypothetical protein